jgi:nicotinamidase-related amidase
MTPALVLVDLQQDFLARPGLVPPVAEVTTAAAALRAACRARAVPVAHVHTLVRPDGSDRMPHWARDDVWTCVEGTPGAAAAPGLEPLPGEPVVRKRFFSGFGNPALGAWLEAGHIDTVIVAGIYLHGCVRSTVLDAYERGYTVWIADDAVGSTEPVHAAETRAWLGRRAATFLDCRAILARLDTRPTTTG